MQTLGGGRYELGSVLGTGGMAQVRSAVDTVLGRPVAVKLFRADLDEDGAGRVRTEMQTLASFAHPGLVAVYDAGTEPDATGTPQPYLVMELVDGPTLAAACLAGSVTPELLLEVGAGLADALDYVHDRGVIHRDVKPANILLSPSGVKLADFGIARIVDGARHTGTGLTLGTAPYLSPEQVTGSSIGPAVDVYALGLVLLECLTGRREYTGGPVETALARLHRQPAVPASLPTPWPELLTAMTARKPADRPTATQVAAVLRGDLRTLPVAAEESTRRLSAQTVLLDTGGTASSSATRLLKGSATQLLEGAATQLLEGPETQLLDGSATQALDISTPDATGAAQARTRIVPRVVARDGLRPGRRKQLLRGALGKIPVLVGLGLLSLVLVVAAVVASGSDAPRTTPTTPTSQLEQHLSDLDRAVTP